MKFRNLLECNVSGCGFIWFILFWFLIIVDFKIKIKLNKLYVYFYVMNIFKKFCLIMFFIGYVCSF